MEAVEALKPPKAAQPEPALMPRVSETAQVPVSGTPLKVASDENAEESDFPMGTPNLYSLTPPLNMFKDSSSGGVSVDIVDDEADQTVNKPHAKEETLADEEGDEEDDTENLKLAFKALAAPHGQVSQLHLWRHSNFV